MRSLSDLVRGDMHGQLIQDKTKSARLEKYYTVMLHTPDTSKELHDSTDIRLVYVRVQ